MYNFSSMSGWHQLRCDQILLSWGMQCFCKKTSRPAKAERFSLHYNFQMCHLLEPNSVSVLSPFMFVALGLNTYMSLTLVKVSCWSTGACCYLLLHVGHLLDQGSCWPPSRDLAFKTLSMSCGWTWLHRTQEEFKLPYTYSCLQSSPFLIFQEKLFFFTITLAEESCCPWPSFILNFLNSCRVASPCTSLPWPGMLLNLNQW